MPIPFNASERPTVGVEMELGLVDRSTRELTSVAGDVLARLDPSKAKHELMACTVEIITGVCKTVADVRSDLEASLHDAHLAAGAAGADLMCAGTHPFSSWSDQELSPVQRYRELVESLQWPARRLQIFGVHAHVGVRSAEKSIAIANALCEYLPHLLALSASSPFWDGFDTGLASARAKVFEALPTAGLPHRVASWDEFERFMATLLNAKAITSIREVWWDVRPHPGFGTVELRICDGIPRLDELASIVALCQSLVDWMDNHLDRGYTLPVPRDWTLAQNKWRAARHGLGAEIIVDDAGTTRLLSGEIADLVDELTPVARRLRCLDELEGVHAIIDRGPSYLRQRRIVADGGSYVDVVEHLVSELRT